MWHSWQRTWRTDNWLLWRAHPGVYCLRTSHADRVVLIMEHLYHVDGSWGDTPFAEIRTWPARDSSPNYRQGWRHLFITVRAYHLVPTVRFRLKQARLPSIWSSIRKLLSTQCCDSIYANQERQYLHVRKSTQKRKRQGVESSYWLLWCRQIGYRACQELLYHHFSILGEERNRSGPHRPGGIIDNGMQIGLPVLTLDLIFGP